MINELKRILKDSTEDEVRSLLFQMLLRIHSVEKIKQYSEEQLVIDMKKTYSGFLNYKENQRNIARNTHYKAVHIVFGDSPAGSLKIALEEMGLKDEEKVITFSDIFSVGPVWRLHEKKGLSNRYEWLKKRKIHIERKNNGFMKSARLIGEAMGHLNQYIGDQFFEYRVRHLIVNGIFEIEGVPKAMRYYSVKLR